jgi:hypothetical protein
MADQLAQFPAPPDDITGARWEESRRRRRMLEGAWREDLRRTLEREYALERRKALGLPDTTKNLFKMVVNGLSKLYDRIPILGHPEEGEAAGGIVETMNGIVNDAGMWQMASTLQQQVLGIRESDYRFSVNLDHMGEPTLQVRVVPADLVHAIAWPDTPDVPHTIYEYRLRIIDGEKMWTRDCLSIMDPENPIYRVETEDGSETISGKAGLVLDEGTWDSSMRFESGRPFLPYPGPYHAQRTGKLYDPFTNVELVDGSLSYASMLQDWKHLVRDAGWPQRAVADLELVGGYQTDEDGTAHITADRSSVLQFRQMKPGVTGQFHTFEPGGDPVTLLNSIQSSGADIASDFDIIPADVARTHTDGRSGHAISITRETQRVAQRRFEPQFRRGDTSSLSRIAAMWNRVAKTSLPEDDWTIKYPGLPLSMQEKEHLLKSHEAMDRLEITSPVVLLAQLTGITEAKARERLREMKQDRFEFAPRGPTNV